MSMSHQTVPLDDPGRDGKRRCAPEAPRDVRTYSGTIGSARVNVDATCRSFIPNRGCWRDSSALSGRSCHGRFRRGVAPRYILRAFQASDTRHAVPIYIDGQWTQKSTEFCGILFKYLKYTDTRTAVGPSPILKPVCTLRKLCPDSQQFLHLLYCDYVLVWLWGWDGVRIVN